MISLWLFMSADICGFDCGVLGSEGTLNRVEQNANIGECRN